VASHIVEASSMQVDWMEKARSQVPRIIGLSRNPDAGQSNRTLMTCNASTPGRYSRR
jgi:hypothetical protein